MPKQLTRNIYKCVYCDKEFDTEEESKNHEVYEHDIIWIPLERKDLNALLNFIVTKNDSLLTETLTRTLFKFVRR